MLAALLDGPAAGLGLDGDHPHLAEEALLAVTVADDLGDDILGHGITAVRLYAFLHHVAGGLPRGEALPGCGGEGLDCLGIAILGLTSAGGGGVCLAGGALGKTALLGELGLVGVDLGVHSCHLVHEGLVAGEVLFCQQLLARRQLLRSLVLQLQKFLIVHRQIPPYLRSSCSWRASAIRSISSAPARGWGSCGRWQPP